MVIFHDFLREHHKARLRAVAEPKALSLHFEYLSSDVFAMPAILSADKIAQVPIVSSAVVGSAMLNSAIVSSASNVSRHDRAGAKVNKGLRHGVPPHVPLLQRTCGCFRIQIAATYAQNCCRGVHRLRREQTEA